MFFLSSKSYLDLGDLDYVQSGVPVRLIGLENKFLVFLRVAILHWFYCMYAAKLVLKIFVMI